MFNPKLEIFNNELGNVRMAFDKEGQPWFLLNDVAAQLGLTNPTEAVKGAVLAKRIDITDKLSISYKECKNEGFGDFWKSISSGENDYSNKVFINEFALYAVVFAAEKKAARNFQKWITREVLPRINRDGGYVLGSEKLSDKDQEEISKKVAELSSEVAQKTAKVQKMSRIAAEADEMYERLAAENAVLYAEITSIKESTSEKFRKMEERAKKMTVPFEGIETSFSLKDSLVTFGAKEDKYSVREFPEER